MYGVVVWFHESRKADLPPCSYSVCDYRVIESISELQQAVRDIIEKNTVLSICEIRVYNLITRSNILEFCEEIDYEAEICRDEPYYIYKCENESCTVRFLLGAEERLDKVLDFLSKIPYDCQVYRGDKLVIVKKDGEVRVVE